MLKVPWHKTPLKRRREILVPASVPPQHARAIRSENRALLIASIARGRRWLNELIANPTANAESIATRDGCSVRKVNMTISLAFLAPDLVKAAIEGRLPHGMGVVPPRRPACRMVPPAPDARASSAIAPHSNRVSADCGLRCRETGFRGRRKKRQYVTRTTDQRSQRPSGRTRTPPIRGLSRPLQEISANGELRGGAGRIRTSNQAVMSQRFRRRRRASFSGAPK